MDSPSKDQTHAGNYKKDHVTFQGLRLSIETRKGEHRRGKDKAGVPWMVKMPVHYGYIKGTVGRDKDQLDIYLGPHKESKKVFVIDQIDHKTGKFDELKVMLGFGSEKQALNAYKSSFSDGQGLARVGAVHPITGDEFKEWIAHGEPTKPFVHPEKLKLTHSEANYVPRARDVQKRCGICAFFNPPRNGTGSCFLVESPIKASGSCDYFEAKKK